MKNEPAINRALLLQTVRRAYGLPVSDLLFVPVGAPSLCYALRCEGQTPYYFLKLWPDVRASRANTLRRDISLPLTQAIYQRGIYPHVPYPIPTREGALWALFSDTPGALFPYLAGSSAPSCWPQPPGLVWEQVARILARLHRSTATLTDVLPPREVFDIAFEADLESGLSRIERIGPRARPGLRHLRELTLPAREAIVAQLTRLRRLQHTVQRRDGPFVLCHTDMGGDNLLVSDQGQISILDWDDATVAPPEHDVQAALGPHLARFLAAYIEAGGARPLQLDHFAFYLLRRYLHDFTVRLLRILEENTTDEQDDDALADMQAHGFAQWAALDQTLDGIAAALRQLNL